MKDKDIEFKWHSDNTAEIGPFFRVAVCLLGRVLRVGVASPRLIRQVVLITSQSVPQSEAVLLFPRKTQDWHIRRPLIVFDEEDRRRTRRRMAGDPRKVRFHSGAALL